MFTPDTSGTLMDRYSRDDVEELRDVTVLLEWVAKGQLRVDAVHVTAPQALRRDVTGLRQVCQDSLHGPLRNANRVSHVPNPRIRFARHAK